VIAAARLQDGDSEGTRAAGYRNGSMPVSSRPWMSVRIPGVPSGMLSVRTSRASCSSPSLVRLQDERDRRRHLLAEQAVVEHAQTRAAAVLRDPCRGQTQLGRLGHDLEDGGLG
jgi:hypothetical protein